MSDLDAIPLNCHQLIEASAGTGKTHTITNLYLRLLLGRATGLPPLAVNKILVLTFTNAATDELRRRIRNRIHQARRVFRQDTGPEDDFLARLMGDSLDKDKDGKLLGAASRLMDEASIFTIHGFCSRVLTEQSFDTGSLFRQELYDDREQLFQQACADFFRSHLTMLPEIEKQLAGKLWSRPEALAARLQPYVYRRELKLTPARAVDVEAVNLEKDREALLADIREAKRGWVKDDIARLLESADLKKRSKPITRLQQMTDLCQGDDLGLDSELWEVYNRDSLEKARKKDGVLPTHPLFNLFNRIWSKQPIIEKLRENLWHVVLEEVRTRIRTTKERRHLLTLDDLLLNVRDAIRRSDSPSEPSALAELLAQRWPVAMIDEFQDTDDIQYEIFSRIYRTDFPHPDSPPKGDAGGRAKDDAGGKAKDDAGGRAKDDAGGRVKDDAGDRAKDDAGGKAKDDAGDRAKDDAGGKAKDDAGGKAKDDAGGKAKGGDRGLLMIGDPKQAIYQFRGADVYTYIKARRAVDRIHSLEKNWRSTPALVEAVNTLFDKQGMFGVGEEIPFAPVKAAHANRQMTIDGEEVAPFELFVVGHAGTGLNKDAARASTLAAPSPEPPPKLRGLDKDSAGASTIAAPSPEPPPKLRGLDKDSAGASTIAAPSPEPPPKLRGLDKDAARTSTLAAPSPEPPPKPRALTKDAARALAMEYAAEQTSRLLNAGDKVRLGGKDDNDNSLKAGEIAFLVKTWKDAAQVHKALARRGIQSVYLTRENVLLQPTADDLIHILRAALDPADDRAVRAALATRLLQCEAGEIEALGHDLQTRQAVIREFQEYHEAWQDRGIAFMLNRLLQKRRLAGKWLGQMAGERELTDFRHLTELLQQGAGLAPGMRQLLNWFMRERQAAGNIDDEQRQLRLESDENLVKIVTMHSAKGLEYDVVMIPMPVFSAHKVAPKGPALYHASEENYRACLEVGDDKSHLERAMEEAIDEEIRLLYVAMTRARYRCYLGVPLIRGLEKTTFGRLLGPFPDSPLPIEEFGEQLRLPANLFNIVDGEVADCTPYRPEAGVQDLVPPPPVPRIDQGWRMHSYTSLSGRPRDLERKTADDAIAGFADDDQGRGDSDGIGERDDSTTAAAEFSRFSFPRGAHVGLVLHKLLEDLDRVMSPEGHGRERACNSALDKLGLGQNRGEWGRALTGWLDDILKTPLHPAATSLERIESHDRLNEMEFHFPVNNPAFVIDGLREAGYLESLQIDPDFQLVGMMTGLIDLTFRHDGKYYVLDYKSNHLGDSFGDYGEAQLRQAIARHHYDLQYLIYSMALHKWLKARSHGYDYERDFGGVFYLFLRGMRGSETGDTGVYFHKPPLAAIEKLSELSGTP